MLFCGISSRRSSSAQQWRRSAAKFSATVQLHRNISEVGDFSKYFGNYWKAPVASRKKTPESQDVTRLYSIPSQNQTKLSVLYFDFFHSCPLRVGIIFQIPLAPFIVPQIFQLCSYEWLCVNLTNFSQFHYGFICWPYSLASRLIVSRVQGLWSVAKPIRSFLMTLNLICHFLSTFSFSNAATTSKTLTQWQKDVIEIENIWRFSL